ncbi:hypothetical protein QYE76_013354 [Lolium multiflorum]|uniref:Uncharacterized protein n=1 Tax=Lolium multiflorum TaxID=4521 RepID=A0AAD8U2S8_LOLMU|nr:hypothetical protein QYE76_013354 [Lolium multiflorum]
MPRFSKSLSSGQDERGSEEASNASGVELEELAKARKSAEEKAARLEEEHKECNQLILQTDALAYRLFPDSRTSSGPFGLARRCGHFSLIGDRLKGQRVAVLIARAGADSPSASLVPGTGARLDALTGVRRRGNRSDPILTAKRQDRAYRIAEYAEMRTFIPPPHGVQDYLDEEEDEAEEEPLDDLWSGDAPPEALLPIIYLNNC